MRLSEHSEIRDIVMSEGGVYHKYDTPKAWTTAMNACIGGCNFDDFWYINIFAVLRGKDVLVKLWYLEKDHTRALHKFLKEYKRYSMSSIPSQRDRWKELLKMLDEHLSDVSEIMTGIDTYSFDVIPVTETDIEKLRKDITHQE